MLLCQQLPFLLHLASILPWMALYFLQGLNSCKFDKLTTLQEKPIKKKNAGKTLTVPSYPVLTSIAISNCHCHFFKIGSNSIPTWSLHTLSYGLHMVYTLSFNKTLPLTRICVRLPKVYGSVLLWLTTTFSRFMRTSTGHAFDTPHYTAMS